MSSSVFMSVSWNRTLGEFISVHVCVHATGLWASSSVFMSVLMEQDFRWFTHQCSCLCSSNRTLGEFISVHVSVHATAVGMS